MKVLIAKLIREAFNEAHSQRNGRSNSERSKLWVECLAHGLRTIPWERQVAVFSRDYNNNQSEFRLNELLFDITVAEVEIIKSVRGANITTITAAKWLVESEFNKTDSRDVIIDFSKLVIGSSENKLLVISAESSLTSWAKEVIPDILKCINCNFFLAFLPHPEDWDAEDLPSIHVYRLTATGWLPIQSSEPA